MAQGVQKPLRPPRRKPPTSHRGEHSAGLQESRQREATITFIKRVLCSKPQYIEATSEKSEHVDSEPLENLLPPLTSSNAIDVQLYALIAVILCNFVQAWYNRITADQEFVAEIVQIIAHCTRGLEQRLRHVDLESLLLDELPELIIEHVNTVRTSRHSRSKELSQDQQRRRFLALRPHLALEPVPSDSDTALAQQENEAAWCMLTVNRVLPLILPPEDMLNPCLDVLVSEIFAEMIFHNGICGKACEPWLIWDAVAKLLRSTRDGESASSGNRSADLQETDGDARSFQAHASQTVSPRTDLRGRLEAIPQIFWLLLQCMVVFWLFLRSSVVALMQASALPQRQLQGDDRRNGAETPSGDTAGDFEVLNEKQKRPIIGMKVWSSAEQILSFNRRMPWMSGMLSLMQWLLLHGPGRLCCTNSRLDRLLSHHIMIRVHSPTIWLPPLLQATRIALFPNNSLAPARIPPSSPEEVARIRRECAAAIIDALPPITWQKFFATMDQERARGEVEGGNLLGLLEDGFVNRHLVVSMVDLVVVRLFPELISSLLIHSVLSDDEKPSLAVDDMANSNLAGSAVRPPNFLEMMQSPKDQKNNV